MRGSMVDIQSAAAEIRRGKKRKKKIETTGQKYNWPALLHRAAITSINLVTGQISCHILVFSGFSDSSSVIGD